MLLQKNLHLQHVYTSFITELELLSFGMNVAEMKQIQSMLNDIQILDINNRIKSLTIDLRKEYKNPLQKPFLG